MDVAVCRKRELIRIWKQNWNEEGRKKHCEAKDAKRVVYMTMDWKSREAVEKVDSCCDGREFLPNKALRRDVTGVSCLNDESGPVKVSADDQKKISKEHMEKLMNGEDEWSDSTDSICDVFREKGPTAVKRRFKTQLTALSL